LRNLAFREASSGPCGRSWPSGRTARWPTRATAARVRRCPSATAGRTYASARRPWGVAEMAGLREGARRRAQGARLEAQGGRRKGQGRNPGNKPGPRALRPAPARLAPRALRPAPSSFRSPWPSGDILALGIRRQACPVPRCGRIRIIPGLGRFHLGRHRGKPHKLPDAETASGISVRVIKAGRLGFAYCTHPTCWKGPSRAPWGYRVWESSCPSFRPGPPARRQGHMDGRIPSLGPEDGIRFATQNHRGGPGGGTGPSR